MALDRSPELRLAMEVMPSVKEMPIKGFSCFSYAGHFVQWSKTIFCNFGRGSFKDHFYEIILKLGTWSMSRYHLRVFLFLALVAILWSRAEPF